MPTATPSVNESTKVTIIGNRIYVPVVIVNGSNEAHTNLILDTGASKTAIYSQIADQLYLNQRNAKNVKMQVADGNLSEASLIMIDSLKIGKHTFHNRYILIIPSKRDASYKFDGLLGMDLLRELNYTLDLNKQVIIWN
jgi:predicted aspartyl protease